MELLQQLVINGIVLGCNFAVVAVTFALVVNTSHIFHVAHGGVYVFGAYTIWVFVARLEFSLWLSIIAVLVVCGLLGGLIEFLIYRPFRQRNIAPVIALLASIGLTYTMQATAALIGSYQPRRLFEAVPVGYPIGLAFITPIGIASIVFCLLVTTFVQYFLRYTRVGICAKAIGFNPLLAKVWGVDSDKVMIVVLPIASAIVGLGGVLQVADRNITPYSGWDVILPALIAYIIGGMGSIIGPCIAAIGMGLITSLIPFRLPTLWTPIIVFGILYFFIIFRNRGIMGKKVWAKEL